MANRKNNNTRRNAASKDEKTERRDNYGKQKRSRGGRYDKSSSYEDKKMTNSFSGNDPSWYNRYPELVRAAATLPGTSIAGVPIHDNGQWNYNSTNAGEETLSRKTPSVFNIHWMPTIGHSEASENDPINVAGRNIYTFVRSKNSRSANYEMADMMLYLLGYDSAFIIVNTLRKIYGLLNTYSPINMAVPNALLKGMGLTDNSIRYLRSNRYEFLGMINDLIIRLNSFPVPADLTFMLRHEWLSTTVWADREGPAAQLYQFVPEAVWKTYNTSGVSDATHLIAGINPIAYFNGDISDINLLRDTIVDKYFLPLLSTSDFDIMRSDLMHAYENNLLKLDGIGMDYVTTIGYSQEVLAQIENSNAYGAPLIMGKNAIDLDDPTELGKNFMSIVQDMSIGRGQIGELYTSVYYGDVRADAIETVPMRASFRKPILNFHKPDVTPDDVMVSTRLRSTILDMYIESDYTNGTWNIFPKCNYGTEWCLFYTVTFNNGNKYVTTRRFYTNNFLRIIEEGVVTYNPNMDAIAMISMFDWHPEVVQLMGPETKDTLESSPDSVYVVHDGLELDKFTLIDNNNIDRLHRVAIMSEFYSPSAMAALNAIM